MNTSINLGLAIKGDVLQLTVSNKGTRGIRLWARSNSWGWSMFSLLVQEREKNTWKEYAIKAVRWTRNIPKVLEIPIGGYIQYELRPSDPSWQGLVLNNRQAVDELLIRIKLTVPQTKEATEQNVFTGELISNVCTSFPPHYWLTESASAEAKY